MYTVYIYSPSFFFFLYILLCPFCPRLVCTSLSPFLCCCCSFYDAIQLLSAVAPIVVCVSPASMRRRRTTDACLLTSRPHALPPTPCCFSILSIREDIRKKKAIVAPVAPWRGLNRLHKPIDGALGGRSNSLCSLASLASAGLLYQYTQYSPIESHLCSVQSWVERVGHA